MRRPSPREDETLREMVEELSRRVAAQEALLATQRDELHAMRAPATSGVLTSETNGASPDPVMPGTRARHGLSRAGLLKAAGAGAAALAAATVGGTGSAFAGSGNMQYGTSNDAGSDETSLTSSNGTATLSVTNGTGAPAISCDGGGGTGISATGNFCGLNASSFISYGVRASGNDGGVYATAAAGDLVTRNAVIGEVTTTNPTLDGSAGLLGQNDATNGYGYGVKGTHAGSGWGGWFTSVSGVGIHADGGTGMGVDAVSSAVEAIRGTATTDDTNAITGSCTGLGSGVGGYSTAGDGVYASGGKNGVEAYGTQTALWGWSGNLGVYGASTSSSAQASAIIGQLVASTPGVGSAAVLGQNDGTNGNGSGVKGTHAGSGSGGWFTSVSGVGVHADGGTGVGLTAVSSKSEAIAASTTTDTASAVSASCVGLGSGVTGSSTKGVGVEGDGGTGRGGVFGGKAAAIRLLPGASSNHPVSGETGDLFLDSSKRLWLCLKGGSKASWKRIALMS